METPQEPFPADAADAPVELSSADRDTIASCEQAINNRKHHFVAIGLALTQIRDRRLYRAV
jgi:hypothetical protein